MKGQNAELIKIVPLLSEYTREVTWPEQVEGMKVYAPTRSLWDKIPWNLRKAFPDSFFTFHFKPEEDAVEIYLEHPEIPQPGAYDDAAVALRRTAIDWPSGYFNSIWHAVVILFNGLRGKRGMEGVPAYYKAHTYLAGDNELRLILTYRTHMIPEWHLSVLPCRFGRLYPWETDELKRAFRMNIPDIDHKFGETRFFWSD